MKGWLYVISNRAVKGMVKVGGTPKDPVAYAQSLDKTGLPFPHEVGYEALVPDVDAAEKAVIEALAAKAEGKGWYSCSISEAVREITALSSIQVMMEGRYDSQTKADKLYEEVSSPDPARRAAILSDPACHPNVLRFAVEREEDEGVLLAMLANPACEGLGEGLADLAERMEGNDAVLLAIASNPRLPGVVIETVFVCASPDSEGFESLLLALVKNPKFSPELLYETVAEHYEFEAVLPAVAARMDCGPEALARVAWQGADDEALRATAKRHPNWSQDIWISHLKEEAKYWPDSVAEHRDCPPVLLEWLWQQGDPDTRLSVVTNPACPQNILLATLTPNVSFGRGRDRQACQSSNETATSPQPFLAPTQGSNDFLPQISEPAYFINRRRVNVRAMT